MTTTTTAPATAAQIAFISSLLEDKSWRLYLVPLAETNPAAWAALPAETREAHTTRNAAACALYETDLEALTKSQASEAIAVLKAW